VVETRVKDGRRIVTLDQTAFYPTGGGQPCDTGTIGSSKVIDVQSEDDCIFHFIDGDVALEIGEEVECEVDWPRRLEMMQQHTGQHVLSQAFFQFFGAETRGFRIADRAAEIDLTLEAQAEEIDDAIIRAEEIANRIVFDNREIRIHEATPETAAGMPLRKESFMTDCIRVIEIADYDWSPCGGTHVKRTGEIGLIAVRGWERAKKMTRVRFVCGARALRDYRAANRTSEAIALKLSVPREEAEAAVSRLQEENKRLSRRVRDLSEVAAKVEARDLFEATNPVNQVRIISKVFDDRDIEELKLIAHRLVEHNGVIALLGARESATARLVFARSSDLSADMNMLIRLACEKIGGRGGGKLDFAQGGGAKTDELENAIEEVKAQLKK
jgi:alanyl-tRNA synthetase